MSKHLESLYQNLPAGISIERAVMNHCLLCICFFACLLLPCDVSGDPSPVNILLIANQMDHSVLLVDPISKQVLATVGVDINGHEVAVSPDGRFGYVPIYGNTWVGKPGSNGSTIQVVDLRRARTVAVIDLNKEVRPHCAHFGPDGLLYVSAELANAIYIVVKRVVSTDYLAASDGLASGDVDVTFSPEQAVQPGMQSAALFEEQAGLVVRRDHPRVRTQMTRESFNELPHIDVHVVLGRPGTGHRVAQRGWERAHVRRRVVLTVPYFIIAAMSAAETDCVAALPSRIADLCVRLLPLKQVRAMFPLPRINTVMVWHQRTNEDPSAKLLRDTVLECGRSR